MAVTHTISTLAALTGLTGLVLAVAPQARRS